MERKKENVGYRSVLRHSAFPQELCIYAVHCPRSEMRAVQQRNACMHAISQPHLHILFCLFVCFQFQLTSCVLAPPLQKAALANDHGPRSSEQSAGRICRSEEPCWN